MPARTPRHPAKDEIEVTLEVQNDVGKNVGKTKNHDFLIGEMADTVSAKMQRKKPPRGGFFLF
jgi:hypothetical protein